jgi:hypothetical protein
VGAGNFFSPPNNEIEALGTGGGFGCLLLGARFDFSADFLKLLYSEMVDLPVGAGPGAGATSFCAGMVGPPRPNNDRVGLGLGAGGAGLGGAAFRGDGPPRPSNERVGLGLGAGRAGSFEGD